MSSDYIITLYQGAPRFRSLERTRLRDSLWTFLTALMWADALVSSLTEIAVHAKNLKAWGEFSGLQVVVKIACAVALLPVQVTIVVDVVNGQEQWFGFTAAGTHWPTVCGYDFIARPCSVVVAAADPLLNVSARSPLGISTETVI